MTAITGYVRAQKRPGELGVHSLDQFHFNVPDLSVAQTFYSEFGLDMQPLGGARPDFVDGKTRAFGGRAQGTFRAHEPAPPRNKRENGMRSIREKEVVLESASRRRPAPGRGGLTTADIRRRMSSTKPWGP